MSVDLPGMGGDFAKGASGPPSVYDTSPAGLGLSPSYLSTGIATATSVSGSSSELAYVEFTAPVTVTVVAEAAATQIVSAGAVTYSGAAIVIEFFCPAIVAGGGNVTGGINLWDGGTDLGRLYDSTIVTPSASGFDYPVSTLKRRLTPTAASHTYNIRIWNTGVSNFIAEAGAGGAGVAMPGFIRVILA